MAAALNGRSEACSVKVILETDAVLPAGVLPRAVFRTSAMFREIGVNVQLSTGAASKSDPHPGCGQPIVALLASGAPTGSNPRALAYAAPFAVSGTRIYVFVNRIIRNHQQDLAQVLTHVLVHEITHVLEGTDHHSEYGIMKAHWDYQDFVLMRFHSLPFADTDVAMIHRGIAKSMMLTADSVAESSTN